MLRIGLGERRGKHFLLAVFFVFTHGCGELTDDAIGARCSSDRGGRWVRGGCKVGKLGVVDRIATGNSGLVMGRLHCGPAEARLAKAGSHGVWSERQPYGACPIGQPHQPRPSQRWVDGLLGQSQDDRN